MKTPKHTAGPWIVLCVPKTAKSVDWMVRNGERTLHLGNKGEADARLIAAAPKLLQALKILNHLAKIDEVRALIAIAEGEE